MKQFAYRESLLTLSQGNRGPGGDISGSVMERYGLTPANPGFHSPGNPMAGGLPTNNLNDALIQISGIVTLLVELQAKQLLKFLGLSKEETKSRKRRVSTFRSFWPSLRNQTPTLELTGSPPLLATPRPVFQTPLRPQTSQ